MPTFQYRALQIDGTIAEGRLEAGGRQEAFRQMEGRGLRPISLAEHRNGKPQKPEPNGKAAKSPDTFPRVYVAMVEAGETGGFLDVVLAQIADFQAREKELRSKVMTALLYPCILLFLAVCVLVVLMVVFIPNFLPVFASFGG